MHGFMVSDDYVKRLGLSDIIDQAQNALLIPISVSTLGEGEENEEGKREKREMRIFLCFFCLKRGGKRENEGEMTKLTLILFFPRLL